MKSSHKWDIFTFFAKEMIQDQCSIQWDKINLWQPSLGTWYMQDCDFEIFISTEKSLLWNLAKSKGLKTLSGLIYESSFSGFPFFFVSFHLLHSKYHQK